MQAVHAEARLGRFVRGVAVGFGIGGVGGGGGGGLDEVAHFEGVAVALGDFGFAAEGEGAVGDELVGVFEEVFVVVGESGGGLWFGGEERDGAGAGGGGGGKVDEVLFAGEAGAPLFFLADLGLGRDGGDGGLWD